MISYKDLMEGRVGQKIVNPTADSKLKQQVREPGDLGKVERLQQMHQNKKGAKMTRVPDTAQRMSSAVSLGADKMTAAKQVLQDVSGVKDEDRKKGSVRTAVDYNDPTQYRRKVKSLSKKMGTGGDEPEVDPSEAEFTPGMDPDAPRKAADLPGAPPRGWTMTSKKPEHQEYTKKLKDYEAFKDAGGQDAPKGRSKKEIEAGMERAQKTGQLAGRDANTAADQEFDKVIQQAASPDLLPGVKIGDKTVGSSADMRHAYQGSGVGQKDKKEMDDDYFNQMMGAIIDPDLATQGKGKGAEEDPAMAALGQRLDLDKTGSIPLTQKGGKDGYNTKVMDPSARDTEAHSQDGEELASDKAYMTKEVKAKQKALRKALNGQDAAAVQDMAFKFKDISDERLDSTIDMFGQNRGQLGKEGKKSALAALEGRGGVDGDRSTIWAGADFGDKVPDEAKKDADGKDLPEGVYDMSKVPSDMKADMKQARAREMVRTYLKQGGVDAYAEHEGFRSIMDMDLEHIKSLKNGGFDGPDNWVWASSPLNQGRGTEDLGSYTQRSVDSRGVTGPDGGSKLGQTTQGRMLKPREQGQFYNDMFADNPLLKTRFENEFGDLKKNTRGQFKGVFDSEKYDELSDEQITAHRKNLVDNYGFDEEQAKTQFPDKGVQSGKSYGNDAKAYDADATRNERQQHQYRKAYDDAIKQKKAGVALFANKSSAEIKQYVQDQINDTEERKANDEREAELEKVRSTQPSFDDIGL